MYLRIIYLFKFSACFPSPETLNFDETHEDVSLSETLTVTYNRSVNHVCLLNLVVYHSQNKKTLQLGFEIGKIRTAGF